MRTSSARASANSTAHVSMESLGLLTGSDEERSEDMVFTGTTIVSNPRCREKLKLVNAAIGVFKTRAVAQRSSLAIHLATFAG